VLNVDAKKLRSCLGYLMEHNKRIYGHVVPDEATLADLEPEREAAVDMTLDDVFAHWDEHEQRFTTTLNVDPVAPRDVGGILGKQYGRAEITRAGAPVRPHEVPDLLAQCFPSLFPKGVGANYREFKVPLTTAEMLTHTIQFGDPRFAQHYRYLFMMVNIKNLDAAYNSISATLSGSIKRANIDGELEDITDEMIAKFSNVVRYNQIKHSLILTEQDFSNSKEMEELIKRKNIIFGILRGTPVYWERQKSRIRHMIAMKGPPTAFVTFSSADNFWPDMIGCFESYVTCVLYTNVIQ
jgi:hypothetical protein